MDRGNEHSTTTFDAANRHLAVEYSDPASLPKRRTSYEVAIRDNGLLKEAPKPEIGSLQVLGVITFRFNGKEWIEK